MKYIIELPEEDKEKFDNATKDDIYGSYYDYNSVIGNAIKNGTPLPKNHGRLIDADKLVYDCSLGGGGCDHICRCDGCSYNIIREHTINEAPTIIEADKGE